LLNSYYNAYVILLRNYASFSKKNNQ